MEPAAIQRGFEECFGTWPAVVSSAPGRVNVIGEHTDYNDGLVLPFGIDRRVCVAAGPGEHGRIRVHSAAMHATSAFDAGASGAAPPRHWSNYFRGAVGVLGQIGGPIAGADLWIGGDLPAGHGVASSAALCVATLTALARLAGTKLEPLAVVQLARRIEHEFAGTPCGIMDPYVSVFGLPGHAVLLDCRTVEHRYVRLHLPGFRFLLVDSGVRHELSDGAYATRVEECRLAAAAVGNRKSPVHSLRDVTLPMLRRPGGSLDAVLLKRARHVVTENERVQAAAIALEDGRVDALGALLSASHASLRDDYEVSCPEIEELIEALNACEGVVGARMIGGGFGGSVLALVHEETVGEVVSRMEHHLGKRGGSEISDLREGVGGPRMDEHAGERGGSEISDVREGTVGSRMEDHVGEGAPGRMTAFVVQATGGCECRDVA